MARIFKVPFATQGDKVAVPDDLQPDGSVSFNQGWGFDYERPNTDPSYKPIARDSMNGLLHDITEAIGDIQRQGYADWSAEAAPYAARATVMHSGAVWISAIESNSSEPGFDANWLQDDYASQADAEAGTNNTRRMTALRVFQALRSAAANASETLRGVLRIGTQAEVDAGTLDDVAVTPKKMRWGFAASLTTNGYVLFPTWLGSLLVQWGVTGNISADSSITVNWPLAYTSACFCIQAIGINSDSSPARDNVPQVVSYSVNSMQLRANGVNGTTTASPQIWFSLGV